MDKQTGRKQPTRTFTTDVPLSLAEKVDEVAIRMDRSRSWIMKQALSAWIDQEEEHHRMTLEGLASVKAGRVVGHEKVVEWTNSLGKEKPLPRPVSHS